MKDKEFLKHVSDETNVTKKEVSEAGHQARNDMQRGGEHLPNRDISTKEDVSIKTPEQLQGISERDQQPSDEQLAKWQNDQQEAKDYFESIRIAQQLMKEKGAGYFDDQGQGDDPQGQSGIQSQVDAEESKTGSSSDKESAEEETRSESQNNTQNR